MNRQRVLGRSEITISAIGLGCWQFSEGRDLGRYWPALSQDTVNQIVAVSLAGGINWFDTAEAYGGGRSEAGLCAALIASGKRNGEVVIATKWWPVLRTVRNLTASITERLRYLAPFAIDLYQVHQPLALASTAAQMDAMAALVAARQIRAVGVSNFSAARMRAAHAALAHHGIPLLSNQVSYSLLNRRIERNGVLQAAKELGITIIAYSPLAQGLLTGKFHRDPDLIRSRPGARKWMPRFWRGGLERSRPVVTALEEMAGAYGVTPAQMALNWLLCTQGDTVVVIPGATTVSQAADNAGTLRFELSQADCRRLAEVSAPFI